MPALKACQSRMGEEAVQRDHTFRIFFGVGGGSMRATAFLGLTLVPAMLLLTRARFAGTLRLIVSLGIVASSRDELGR